MTVALSSSEGSAPARAVRYEVPAYERAVFIATVTHADRERIHELFAAFADIDSRANLDEGAAYAAEARKHLGRGWEGRTLLNLHRAFRKGGYKCGDYQKKGQKYNPGDWRILLRGYQGNTSRLPEEFITFWRALQAEFTGRDDCVSAAWRDLVQERWLKGRAVPGYGTLTDWCTAQGRALPNRVLIRAADLPEGWSENNLRRYLPTRKVTRARVAHGYLEAHTHQPDQVLGDRSSLMPLERIFFDDVRPDMRSLWFGSSGRGEIVYPLMVLGLDAASGVDVGNSTKPRALREDGSGKRHGVTRDMTIYTLCSILRQWGLPVGYPMTIVHENAAACVDGDTKALLRDAFGDRIQFEATGIFKEKMLAHGFTDRGGCPWDKGQIEAFFRIMQTQLANLPGATGPRFDTQHGELRAAEDYILKCLDRAGDCRAVIDALRSPILRWEEMDKRLQEVLRLLRFRTNHALQGFDQLIEFRLSPSEPWRPESELARLSPGEMERAEIVRRLESPAERFVRKLHGVQLTPVDPDILDYLCGEKRTVRVRSGKVAWQDATLGSVPLIFREPGHALLEDKFEGTEFEAALAPDTNRLILSREGRLIGTVARQDRIDMRDRQAIKEEAGRVRAARCADRETLRGYLADADLHLEEMHTHNAAVLAAAPQIAAGARADQAALEAATPPPAPRREAAEQATKQRNRAAQLAAAAKANLGEA